MFGEAQEEIPIAAGMPYVVKVSDIFQSAAPHRTCGCLHRSFLQEAEKHFSLEKHNLFRPLLFRN
jgi:hypothetical protein